MVVHELMNNDIKLVTVKIYWKISIIIYHTYEFFNFVFYEIKKAVKSKLFQGLFFAISCFYKQELNSSCYYIFHKSLQIQVKYISITNFSHSTVLDVHTQPREKGLKVSEQ